MRLRLCAALLAYGCAPSPPHTKALPPEPQAEAQRLLLPDSPAVVPDPEPAPTVADTPPPPVVRVTRTDGRTEVVLVHRPEELLAIPGGVAWTQDGEVWALRSDDDAPILVAELTDPHRLATDGQTLYWVGHTENGKWDLTTGEFASWRVFARPGQQEGLAFGDVLYGQGASSVWRFEGQHVGRLPVRIEPSWSVLGFAAGKDRVVLGVVALDLQAPGGIKAHKQYVRVRSSGEKTVVPTHLKPYRKYWSVNAAGDLAFIQDRAGTVAVLQANRKTAKVTFKEPGVTTLCFCGPDLCTAADGTLRRHTGGNAETIAEPGPVGLLSCTDKSVAWTGTKDAEMRVTVQSLVPPGAASASDG